MPWPVALDLFSGCGGLTLGLRHARFRVLGAIENNPLAAAAYRLNHHRTRLWERDIRLVTSSEILRSLGLRPGQLDLLAGCPPCQGFSSLRTKNGSRRVEDERNDLVLEFARLARGLRPAAIMLENVPGLADDDRLFRLIDTLDDLGYTTDFDILNVAHYGVPQRRRRLILLAGRSGRLPFAERAPDQKTVRDAIGTLPIPGVSGDRLHDLPEVRHPRIAQLIARIPKDGGSRNQLGPDSQLACHRGFDGFHDVYGRMAWDDVSPTITSGCVNPSKGRFLHPAQDRAITLREAALLQSFPPSYRFPTAGKYALAELIGNALPPEFVRYHALAVRRHLKNSR